MEKIGILGGTFDPVHLGHLIPAQYACDFLALDRLILVPSATPVHRPRHHPASDQHRLAMCSLAAASLPTFDVSDIETTRPEPSYTALTLASLKERFGSATRLILLVGEDNLPLLHTWWHIKEILSLATVAIMPRPAPAPAHLGPLRAVLGDHAVDALIASRVPSPLIPITATDIRNRVGRSLPILGMVPASVAEHIAHTGLYRNDAFTRPRGPVPP